MSAESAPLSPSEERNVYWYVCDCPWLTKYCDDEHRAMSRVPVAVLSQYAVAPARTQEEDQS